MRYRFCKRQGASILERSRAYVTWLASRYILYEDVLLYRSIQEGMEQQTLEEQPLHREERAIAHVHHGHQQKIDEEIEVEASSSNISDGAQDPQPKLWRVQ